jgi:hypothetical protein
LEDEFCTPLPPEASEMPLKRAPEAVSSLPLWIKGETKVSKGCQLGSKPRPGSYSSALLKTTKLLIPPATSTLPAGSNVAVCKTRPATRLPVTVHLPVAGSYSSALLKNNMPLYPPATSTLPEGSNVAV